MSLIEWDEQYSVGVPLMDSQHQKWFHYINEFHEVVTDGSDHDEISELLDNLVIYSRYHFASEERLLKRVEFPELSQHEDDHARMTRRLLSLQEMFLSGKLEAAEELLKTLSSWVDEHILADDREYGIFIGSAETRECLLVR